MRVSLFWRVGLIFLCLVIAILISVEWIGTSVLRSQGIAEGFNRLELLAQISQGHLPNLDDQQSLGAWVAQRAGGDAEVAVIANDGRVLAQSQSSATEEDSSQLAQLPEVREAFSSSAGRAQAVRHDAILNRDVQSLAFRDGFGSTPVVVRFALPVPSIQASQMRLRRQVWLASLLMLVLAVAVCIGFSRHYLSRIGQLRAFAVRAASGDFTALDRDRTPDELSGLADTLSASIAQMGQSIRTLTEERNRTTAILSSMVEGVAVVRSDERIVYCNRAFEQILELQGGSSQGRKLVEALRQVELVSAVRRILSGGEEVSGEVEVGTVRRRSFSVTAAPVRGVQETGAVLVLHDITELRRLERVRRDFVANVSHEFKTPLTAIQGFAETLLSGALDDTANRQRFVQIIDEQAQKLSRLTDDLLKLSRIEAGQMELELRPVNVAALVDSCMETARLKARDKGLNIRGQVSENLPTLRADSARLGEVLQNLIDNALQYTPRGGQVDIIASHQNHSVVFTVADSGIGIPEADLERIFERFYRVDAARSREAGGTGLGLSIARHIVEAHGGRIWVESAVGQGSRFHFSVPVTA